MIIAQVTEGQISVFFSIAQDKHKCKPPDWAACMVSEQIMSDPFKLSLIHAPQAFYLEKYPAFCEGQVHPAYSFPHIHRYHFLLI
ncbi:MAG: hypothetical protein IJY40_01520 [Oscillospiraceae bacterium]|nr:hypothetical protein [Oscillospiraceae bacterium]